MIEDTRRKNIGFSEPSHRRLKTVAAQHGVKMADLADQLLQYGISKIESGELEVTAGIQFAEAASEDATA